MDCRITQMRTMDLVCRTSTCSVFDGRAVPWALSPEIKCSRIAMRVAIQPFKHELEVTYTLRRGFPQFHTEVTADASPNNQ